MSNAQTRAAHGHDAEKSPGPSRDRQPIRQHPEGKTGEALLPDLLPGSTPARPSERWAGLLGNARFSHYANGAQRARIVSGLQRIYGNTYVQRVIERVRSARVETAYMGNEAQVEEGQAQTSVKTSAMTSLALAKLAGAKLSQWRKTLITAVKKSKTAKKTIEAIEKKTGKPIKIKTSTKGSFQMGGEVYIDNNEPFDKQVNSLSHEINHLHDYVFGKQPDVTKMPKAEFVKKKMDNEIRAHYKTYLAFEERGAKGAQPLGYAGFKAKVDQETKKKGKALTAAEKEKVGKEYLEEQYKKVWVGSKSGKNYYQKWEEYWDQNNKRKSGS